MRFSLLLVLFSLLYSGLTAASGEMSSEEATAARKTAIGNSLIFQNLPVDAARVGPVRMNRIDIYAPDAVILVQTEEGFRELPRSNWAHFISDSTVAGAPRLGVSIAADGSDAVGVLFSTSGETLVIRGTPSERGLQFSLRDSKETDEGLPTSFQCENHRLDSMHQLSKDSGAQSGVPDLRTSRPVMGRGAGLPAAVVAVDTDNEFMLEKFADNTTAATNYLAQLFVGLNTIYARDLQLGMLQGTTILRVSTTPDPYTANNINGQLDEFGTLWQTTQGGVARAFSMLLSGKAANQFSSSGLAWVLGNTNYCNATQSVGGHYSVTQVFKFQGATANDDLGVIAHELGHNLGAEHAHCSNSTSGAGGQSTNTIDQCFNTEDGCYSGPTSCPAPGTVNGVANVTGTLMSYCHLNGIPGCSFSNVFATAHRTLLTPRVANNIALGCFGTAGGPDLIFDNGFEGGQTPSDLVTINNIDFVPPADNTGGSIRWRDGSTCACDVAPYNFNIYGSTVPRFFFVLDEEDAVSLDGSTYAVLGAGATIGPDSTFISSTQTAATQSWHTPGNVDGFLGFRFNDGIVKYGYARITTGPGGRPITIRSLSYNNVGAAVTIP